ncbi:hypothetical protein PG985_012193 [Apiospora marii]|uniref:Uncharacterized protein n=1 Tax=Apiospora marii TaxID=335849 RepID=A0ABR1RE12_9PEZI
MQRRNSTKSGALDRRKSISSVKSVQLLHMSTEQAERDARVAATQAFRQARERSATESALWPPSRQPTRPSLDRHYSSPDRRSNESGSCKQQSVRFVKPKLSGGLAQLRRQHDKTPTRTSGTARPRTSETDAPRPWPIPHRTSTSRMTSPAKGTTGNYIDALITSEEYYTPEDNIASEPSSYRRIRKSRSLFSSYDGIALGAKSPGTQLPENLSPSFVSSAYYPPVENVGLPTLNAPKSMSFLKSRREQSRPLSARRDSMPLVTRAANAIPLPSTMEQSVSSHSSQHLGSKSHKAGKAFRRTLRDTSDTTESESLSLTETVPKDKTIGIKARKVSHTLKTRIKSFFNLAKADNDETDFPPQQIEAQKTHVVEVENENPVTHAAPSEDAALSRVTSGVPSLHAVPSEQQLRSQQVSLESLRSERKLSDEKSRVTSWTNSDVHTSTATSSQGREWEKQRLSVIKENGAHISSATSRRPDLARQWTERSPSANFPTEEVPTDTSANVDSQRIYSALMKRLSETREAALALEKGNRRGLGQSSEDTASLRSSVAPTIRHVVSDESIGQKATDVESGPAFTEDHRPSSGSSNESDCDTLSHAHQAEITSSQAGDAEDAPRMRTLSARPSAFFGSPTCHLFRTQSPYRRALQGSISTATDLIGSPKSSEFNPFMPSLNNLPIRSVSRCDSDVDGKMHYSESIYSNEEANSRPTSDTRPLMDSFPSPPNSLGAVTIFVDPPKPQIPPKSHRRLTSTASSVEWKTWLSANVSKLEDSALADDQGDGEQDLSLTRFPPVSGHLREKAQISDCDEEDETTEPLAPSQSNNALGNLELHALNNAPRPKPVMANMDALSDKENKPPPIPLKSALRSTPSAASLGSSTERSFVSVNESGEKPLDTRTPKPLTHARPTVPLGPQPQNRTPSPVKLVRRQQKSTNNAAHGHMSGIGEAVEKQFGKVTQPPSSNNLPTGQGARGSENIYPTRHTVKSEHSEGQDNLSQVSKENTDPQAMGSKQMVDLFLSSRRRRIAGSDEEGHEPAFV